jgi:N-formylglutamate amidohydrolase
MPGENNLISLVERPAGARMTRGKTATGRMVPPPFELALPDRQLTPVIYASPHSGTHYPDELLASTDLPLNLLRGCEDTFVEELFAAAPAHGSPLLHGQYGRSFVDLNREPWELDAEMFAEQLPPHVNTMSLRVASGLGTLPRVAADGQQIYRSKLPLDAAVRRIEQVYFPYHRALAEMISRTRREFGYCIVIDCHSMPANARQGGRRRPDIILGDRFGTTCTPQLTDLVHHQLAGQGLLVMRNNPYAGGFTTYNYGRPATGVHALQIEINRDLYMDEIRLLRRPGFAKLQQTVAALIGEIRRLDPSHFEQPDIAAE